jgi:hypothetical protein
MKWKFVLACTATSAIAGLVPAMIANSQSGGAAMRAMDNNCPPGYVAPAPTSQYVAPAPQATVTPAPTAPGFEIDWDGLSRTVAPNLSNWLNPQQPAALTRGADWLKPIGGQVEISAKALKTITHLKAGGAGQNVETIYKLLGQPTRVDLDNASGKPAIAYWNTPSETIIGVVSETDPSYLGIGIN